MGLTGTGQPFTTAISGGTTPTYLTSITGAELDNVFTGPSGFLKKIGTASYILDTSPSGGGYWDRTGTIIQQHTLADNLELYNIVPTKVFGVDGATGNTYIKGSMSTDNIASYTAHPSFSTDTQIIDKKYVNDQDIITLSQAKTYSETASGNSYGQSVSYTNAASANLVSYIDQRDIYFNNLSISYTNSASSDLIAYTDTASGNLVNYIDSKVAAQNELKEVLANGNSAGLYQIDMNFNKIINVDTPTASGNAANKLYVDSAVAAGGGCNWIDDNDILYPTISTNSVGLNNDSKLYFDTAKVNSIYYDAISNNMLVMQTPDNAGILITTDPETWYNSLVIQQGWVWLSAQDHSGPAGTWHSGYSNFWYDSSHAYSQLGATNGAIVSELSMREDQIDLFIRQGSPDSTKILMTLTDLSLKDSHLSSLIPLSQTGTAGLAGFTATSIIGALNELKAGAAAQNELKEVLANGNDANNIKITNLGDPTQPKDATNKQYVDTVAADASGNSYVQSITYTNTATGSLKVYVDNQDLSILSQSKTYSETASGNAYAQSVTHTDSATASLKVYVDNQDLSILAQSKTYSETASGNAYNQSVTYTNTASSSLLAYDVIQDAALLSQSYTYTNASSASFVSKSGDTMTGDLAIDSTAPEYKLTDTNDTRLTRIATLNQANLYHEVSVGGADGTGGAITHSGGYTVHTFTSNGTFTIGATIDAKVLVVAGGGSGGHNLGGGGGAGGYVYDGSYEITAGSYDVTVGTGGAGVTAGDGNKGNDSEFETLTVAEGGGAGGGYGDGNGKNGGCGGGGGGDTGTAGSGTQQYDGGDGAPLSTYFIAGGGGGGSEVGEDAGSVIINYGGAGGDGVVNPIAESVVGELVSGDYYLCGGGGGGGYQPQNDSHPGPGGKGGGGAGGYTTSQNGTDGTDTYGAGGGGTAAGGGGTSGKGGDGVVIIAYIPAASTVEEITLIDSRDSAGVSEYGITTFGDSRGETILQGSRLVLGTGALSTTATTGFAYVSTCTGAPSGVPTATTGMVPIVYDSSNNYLYVYNGGWKKNSQFS